MVSCNYLYLIIIIIIHFHNYMVSCVFANVPVDQDLIPGQVIPKTQKMLLDAALLNTRHYKV